MKQKIMESLGYSFKYDPEVQKTFLVILDIRYGRNSEIYAQFQNLTSDKKLSQEQLEEENFLEELKRLNLMALKSRLAFIEENKIQETVVISYMKLLVKEIEHPTLCNPSVEIEQAEEAMFHHLLDVAIFNDELTELEGISNTNFRMILQTWVLYPEYLRQKEKCAELLECLSITCYEL